MKDLLKLVICGSVDDGKSTLIGHLLYDAKLIFADQKQQLEIESKAMGNDGIDYSLLLDGLMSEREQGITIDVAYRFFTTKERSFIAADAPGHEEYTRNMAVGASFADSAVILIDVQKGVLPQTKRHLRICLMMGIKYFIFALNKMDLVEYSQRVYEKIETNINEVVSEFNYTQCIVVPVSAKVGDNIIECSDNMLWYKGSCLISILNSIDINKDNSRNELIMPVQRVCKNKNGKRGFQGEIVQGKISVDDVITVYPSKERTKVTNIYYTDKLAETAEKGQSVTISTKREVDISRGCILSSDANLIIGNIFRAYLLWFDNEKLQKNKMYYLKIGTMTINASVTEINYRIDINHGEKIYNQDTIYKNSIAVCEVTVSENIPFTAFSYNQDMGRFILIDRITNNTCACGTIIEDLQDSRNLFCYQTDITREARGKLMAQKPLTIWFTGLSGAGKSALANALEKKLFNIGKHTMLLDGDNTRVGLNRNLSFSKEDRTENIRRVAEVAKLMNDAGLIVITAFISPYHIDRRRAREIIGDSFVEVYVNTALEECEKRDKKGLYKKARRGEISDFTGISSVYDVPEKPDIVIDASAGTAEKNVERLFCKIKDYL